MRYKVKRFEIRSENAAKPIAQASAYLSNWISAHPPIPSALDYGCGKLRYAYLLAAHVKALTLVDSDIQLARPQIINGEKTTVRDYAADQWPHSRTLSPQQFKKDRGKYDLVLCANVLSAIPVARTQNEVLRLISSRLKLSGRCLFVAQYRNSYFKEVSQSERAIPHLDGWIVKNSRGYSYYGILPKSKLEVLVKRNHFRVIRSWINGQSAYVLTGPKGSLQTAPADAL